MGNKPVIIKVSVSGVIKAYNIFRKLLGKLSWSIKKKYMKLEYYGRNIRYK